MYHLNPILLISFQRELSLQYFHTMEEGTTQVITGAIKLAYNRGHYYRQPRNQKFTCWSSTPLEDTTQGFSKLEQLINNCRHPVANRQPTTLTTQDLDQSSGLLCEDGTTISYSQEMKDLMEQQEVAAASSIKTL
jgi:cysteinyl-tRNA synthetase